MIKRVVKETVKEYDKHGTLVRESVTETTEEDDTVYTTSYNTYPISDAECEDDIYLS